MKCRKGLKGKRVLVTAGPTREPIDAVRFISNPSTGRMGFALASAARRRGAEVILVSGPTVLPPPQGVNFVQVETALEMRRAVFANLTGANIFIAAAAVADYRPTKFFPGKIKKRRRKNLLLQLEPNPDILREVGEKKGKKILVGFSAETEDLVKNAHLKLWEKNLDLIVTNDLTREGSGFASETNQVRLMDREGKIENLPRMSKARVAECILDRVEEMIKEKREKD
ncbi:bifunctional phosphopantothenoylcysteine decarboxylase/phosphopantothenate--cysteine ligase CoaBC [candidate division NPL-UPA2 bacterium]|nr:bifunctional phosphopantothenoylcysteine decarboxylase/phosphopantothenate--cysteine ligase CoaBC [candidate division NPL-UPA2 bacterium]